MMLVTYNYCDGDTKVSYKTVPSSPGGAAVGMLSQEAAVV